MKHGKKYNQGAQLVDRAALYEPSEALDIAVKTATAKFDETVEVHIRLGVDSRHADQQVRGAVVLPNGTGKKVRVAVFAKGADAEAATAAGAEIVGAEDLVAKIQGEGFMDFDVAIAAPNMMGLVGRLGKVLGPRGLMPAPRQARLPPMLPRLSTRLRPVRSSTVSTRPTSSTAPSARLPSALRSSVRTSTPCSTL